MRRIINRATIIAQQQAMIRSGDRQVFFGPAIEVLPRPNKKQQVRTKVKTSRGLVSRWYVGVPSIGG